VSAFRGLSALLRAKLGPIPRIALPIGLFIGLSFGFLARLGSRDVNDFLPVLTMFFMALSAAMGPLAATGGDTISGGQAGTRSRREELLALPLGRFALPTAYLVASAAGALACFASVAAGFAVWFGPHAVLASVMVQIPGASGGNLPDGMARLGCDLLLFTACFSFGATGSHRASFACLAAGPPIAVALLSLAMGYTGPEAWAFAAFSGAFLAVYFLVLPFVLYARPAHHWSSVRGYRDRESVDLLAFGVSLGAITALGMFGVLPAAIVLAAGVAIVVRVGRALPRIERPGVPHTRIVHALALLALAPPVVLGLVTDGRRFADGGEPAGKHVRQYAVSPDGRSAAAVFHSGDDPAHGLSRVVVADLDGKAPPRVLPTRWARLEGPCWSSDGRYLAVRDGSVGRILGREMADDSEAPRAVACVFQYLQGTLVLDTRTGDLSSLPLCVATPGWESPGDLIRITAGLVGEDEVADGRGRHASLRRAERVRVEACEAPGALVRLVTGEVRRLSASGLAPVVSSTVWIATATPEPAGTPGEPARASIVKLVRGDESVTIHHVERALWVAADAYYAETEAGFVRYALPGLEAKVLVPAAELRLVLGTEHAAHENRAAPPWILVRTHDGYRVVDVATGGVEPLFVPAGFSPEVVVGKRVVGRGPHEELLVRDGDGAPRPVFEAQAAR
jgi:hypothetical protein